MMKLILPFLLFLAPHAQASFIFQYGLNYSSEVDDSDIDDYDKKRTFHKLFLGASVNGPKTLFLGWNINSWSSSLDRGGVEDTYALTEMGPKLVWYMDDERHWYLSTEWNPYAKGSRDKGGTNRDIRGSSLGLGFGYRFRLGRLMGLGAGLHYHAISLDEEKVGNTVEDVSSKVSHIMPTLELTFITP